MAPARASRSHSVRTLVLPPVTWIPHWAWLYAGSTGAGSTRITAGSTSSSSATIIGRAV